MYKFNEKDFVLRIEYFGGLLIRKSTMEKYQLSKYDTFFLWAIKNSYEYTAILDKMYEKFNVRFEPDVDTYIKLGIIWEDAAQITYNNDFERCFQCFHEVEKINHLRSPIELTIYPSLKCQLDCKFCFLHEARKKHVQEYSYDKWIDVINSFVEEGVVSISILGGEPSLYCDIIPLLKEMDKLNIRISLTTNGQNWSDELFATIVESRNITTIVSIESMEQVKNAERMGSRCQVSKAKELLKRLRDKKKPCRINSVYTYQSKQELLDIVDFCAEIGVEKYSLALCFGHGEGIPSIKETNEIGQMIHTYIKEKNYRGLFFSVEGCMLYSSYDNIDGSLVYTEFQMKQYGCECGNTILEAIADGSMYSCAAFIANANPVGNLFQEDWRKVWFQSDRLNYLRNTKCTDEKCVKCSLYHFCNGGCPSYKQTVMSGHEFESYDDRCVIHQSL